MTHPRTPAAPRCSPTSAALSRRLLSRRSLARSIHWGAHSVSRFDASSSLEEGAGDADGVHHTPGPGHRLARLQVGASDGHDVPGSEVSAGTGTSRNGHHAVSRSRPQQHGPLTCKVCGVEDAPRRAATPVGGSVPGVAATATITTTEAAAAAATTSEGLGSGHSPATGYEKETARLCMLQRQYVCSHYSLKGCAVNTRGEHPVRTPHGPPPGPRRSGSPA